jgi:hypothetical protein
MDANTLEHAAAALGYERIDWDPENNCYSGYGSSDPCDRSRDDNGGAFVAHTPRELAAILAQS